MRKIKALVVVLLVLLTSGCYKNELNSKSEIRVSSYPIEYVTTYLYRDYDTKQAFCTIKSIYPDGIDKDFVLNDKLIKDYSSTNLFIFNDNNENENEYVDKMNKNNKYLNITNATSSLTYTYGIEELWLDPINLLTVANNIKKGFKEYQSVKNINDSIDKNYEDLKTELIKLDADYRDVVKRANKKTIVVGNNVFKYLTKYNLNVISLDSADNLSKKTLYEVEQLVKNKSVTNIYITKGSKTNKNIDNLKTKYNVNIIELNNIYTLSDEERKNSSDYVSLMRNNLELLKSELYS